MVFHSALILGYVEEMDDEGDRWTDIWPIVDVVVVIFVVFVIIDGSICAIFFFSCSWIVQG